MFKIKVRIGHLLSKAVLLTKAVAFMIMHAVIPQSLYSTGLIRDFKSAVCVCVCQSHAELTPWLSLFGDGGSSSWDHRGSAERHAETRRPAHPTTPPPHHGPHPHPPGEPPLQGVNRCQGGTGRGGWEVEWRVQGLAPEPGP